MKTVQIGKYKLALYDSIDELPIKRFHKFNKYMLIDSGIGSDLNDFNTRVARVRSFMETDKALAVRELENLRQSLYMISEEVNTKHLSLIPMIHSIDGVELVDISEENANAILEMLSSAQTGWFNNLIDTLKKKFDDELSLFFPTLFDDTAVKEYYDKLKSRTQLLLQAILHETDNEAKIHEIDSFLLTLAKPNLYSGRDSIEIQYSKQFEEMVLFLAKNLNVIVENMSVLQFYNSFVYLKNQTK